jgi:cobalt/nickel transport system ATP-binding protein
VKLRLPQIAELIYRLKHEDHLPFKKIPLTIGEARREMLKLLEDKDRGTSHKKVGH